MSRRLTDMEAMASASAMVWNSTSHSSSAKKPFCWAMMAGAILMSLPVTAHTRCSPLPSLMNASSWGPA